MCITKESALKIILGISVLGLIFSGVLSYGELVKGSCALGTCGGQQLASVPVCVYGFVMYLVVFVISILGLRSKK